jgi:hypothetical protein
MSFIVLACDYLRRKGMNRNRRHTPSWWKQRIYRIWVLEREGTTEEELTEEEEQKLERSKAWHPSRGPLQS